MERVRSVEELAKNLRTVRQEQGFTQREVADMLGINRSVYAAWEAARRIPGALRLLDIAELYQVPVNWLLCRHMVAGFLPIRAKWDDPCPEEIVQLEQVPCIATW